MRAHIPSYVSRVLLPFHAQGGCIIRAGFLGDVSAAYERNLDLPNLLVDPMFSKELAKRDAAWRRVVGAHRHTHAHGHSHAHTGACTRTHTNKLWLARA